MVDCSGSMTHMSRVTKFDGGWIENCYRYEAKPNYGAGHHRRFLRSMYFNHERAAPNKKAQYCRNPTRDFN